MERTVIGFPVSFLNVTSCPTPPRNSPAPPLSGIIFLLSTLMPVIDSQISTGTAAIFDGPGKQSRPSKPCNAPNPPDTK